MLPHYIDFVNAFYALVLLGLVVVLVLVFAAVFTVVLVLVFYSSFGDYHAVFYTLNGIALIGRWVSWSGMRM